MWLVAVCTGDVNDTNIDGRRAIHDRIGFLVPYAKWANKNLPIHEQTKALSGHLAKIVV